MDGELTEDEERDAGVLSGLPRSRPQLRSPRRAAPAATAPAAKPAAKGRARPASPRAKAGKATAPKPAAVGASRLRQPAQPRGAPPQPSRAADPRPPAPSPEGVVTAAVHAAEEVARLGAAVGGQFLKGALRRIPRP